MAEYDYVSDSKINRLGREIPRGIKESPKQLTKTQTRRYKEPSSQEIGPRERIQSPSPPIRSQV
jgi:hypothetical protein